MKLYITSTAMRGSRRRGAARPQSPSAGERGVCVCACVCVCVSVCVCY